MDVETHHDRVRRVKRAIKPLPAVEIIPERFHEQAAEVEELWRRAEEMSDRTRDAARAVQEAKRDDAVELRRAIIDGKDPTTAVSDRHERAALSNLVLAQRAEGAVVGVLVDKSRALSQELDSLGVTSEIEKTARQHTAELGERYAALVDEWRTLRPAYLAAIARQGRATMARARAEHAARTQTTGPAVLDESFPGVWRPSGQNEVVGPDGKVATTKNLADVLAADAARHVEPPPKRPTVDDQILTRHMADAADGRRAGAGIVFG